MEGGIGERWTLKTVGGCPPKQIGGGMLPPPQKKKTGGRLEVETSATPQTL